MDVVLPKPETYIVAVSGGVDSVSMLTILHNQPGLKLVVAHLDHGIREDSVKDRKLVEDIAKQLDLSFVYEEARLGSGASEAKAREVRYDFLRRVMKDRSAQAIITAHHQDDLLETAILNMLRGTGRKGLTALKSRDDLIRPLLKVPKQELIQYAKKNGLKWREDSTNHDTTHLRNYVRHEVLPHFSSLDRVKLVSMLTNLEVNNQELDAALEDIIKVQTAKNHLNRSWFNQLPHNVAKEVLASWLRANEIRNFDSKILERLVVAAKTGKVGKTFPVLEGYSLEVSKDNLALVRVER